MSNGIVIVSIIKTFESFIKSFVVQYAIILLKRIVYNDKGKVNFKLWQGLFFIFWGNAIYDGNMSKKHCIIQ